jgi:hypothetical protein
MSILREIRKLFTDVKLEREAMHDYQQTAYNFLRDNPYSGLFIDMGLGKTVSTATLVVDLLNDFKISAGKKVLIIGPKKVALTTWPDEFRTWRHLAPFVPQVIHVDDKDKRLKAYRKQCLQDGLERQMFPTERGKYADQLVAHRVIKLREEAALSNKQIHIISRDWIEWLVDFYGKDWPYEVVIIDESSGFKDHKSGRFEALKSVRTQPSNPIKRLHILTATPATEGYEGLFSQIFLLDKGTRLGRKVTHYREKYFVENRYDHSLKLRPGAEKAILAKISDICLVMKEKDYLEREEPLYVQRVVHMEPDQMAKYLSMEQTMVTKLDDGTVVKADTAAALSQKLLQMASGVLYDTKLEPGQTEDDDHVKVLKVHHIHDHKIDMLKQIIEEAQGKNILVAYHHKSSKDRLKKHFPGIKFMDAEGKLKKPWNDGKIPLLAMHPASGGHGLNLQLGGHIIVFFDIPWSLELYQQFIGRLSRQGQKYRVTVFLIVCDKTKDREVVSALNDKDAGQEKLKKIMQKMRRKLMKMLGKMRRMPETDEDWEAIHEALEDYGESEQFESDEL